MDIRIAELIWVGVALYLGVGLLVAAGFLAVGVGKVDVAARGSTLLFRVLTFPGATVLWPFVLARWLSGRLINTPNEETAP